MPFAKSVLPFYRSHRGGKKSMNLTDRVLAFLLDCPEDQLKELSVKILARRFNVSRVYLSRSCRRNFGVPLKLLLHRERMERSKELLRRSPELSVSQVCHRVGLDDTRYFCRIFNDYYSISPRRLHDKSAADTSSR
jgi:AraC-like DNA-binding protein